MIKVFLRQKPIGKGQNSLYLDFYPAVTHPETGKLTRRQFLKMYVYRNPKNEIEKAYNKNMLGLAEKEKAKRQMDVLENRFGFLSQTAREKDFIEYFLQMAEKRKSSNYDNWISAGKHLTNFTGGYKKFYEVNEKFCNEFRAYLLKAPSRKNKTGKPLSINSAVSYFNKLRAALREAYREGLIDSDVNARLKSIPYEETQRAFLTIEELRKLVKTECKNPQLKQAALFSALTGLRFSDIVRITWGQIGHSKGRGFYIPYRQKKTGGAEVIPVSDEAVELLGTRGEPDQGIFSGLTYSFSNNEILKEWIKEAGIIKRITFHNFRHSYATLQIAAGTDVFVVQKMLGHKSIKTTMIYAKLIDEKKQETVNRIKLSE